MGGAFALLRQTRFPVFLLAQSKAADWWQVCGSGSSPSKLGTFKISFALLNCKMALRLLHEHAYNICHQDPEEERAYPLNLRHRKARGSVVRSMSCLLFMAA